MMKRVLAGVLLGTLSCAASAAWVKVWTEPDKSFAVHADPKTRAKKGQVVTLKIVKDYQQPQPFLTPYRSAVEQFEANCKEATFRDVQAVFHTKPMGDGDAVHTADRSRNLWSPAARDTYIAAVWQYACKRKLPAEKKKADEKPPAGKQASAKQAAPKSSAPGQAPK